MKPSFVAPLPILLCINVLFLQQISFTDARKSVIEIACAQTKARDLCISIIKSDPRSTSGNVGVFSVIVLEKALSEANDMKGRCPESYKKFVGDVEDAMQKLKTKPNVPSAERCINSAINDVVSCSNGVDALVTILSIAKDVLNIIN